LRLSLGHVWPTESEDVKLNVTDRSPQFISGKLDLFVIKSRLVFGAFRTKDTKGTIPVYLHVQVTLCRSIYINLPCHFATHITALLLLILCCNLSSSFQQFS
jgi:hypothetical protein